MDDGDTDEGEERAYAERRGAWHGRRGAVDGPNMGEWAMGRVFLDLTSLADDIEVLPMDLPAGLHFYWNHPNLSKIHAQAVVCHSTYFSHLSQLETYLRSPGIHGVLYVEILPDGHFIVEETGGPTPIRYQLRSYHTTDDKDPDCYRLNVVMPRHPREWMPEMGDGL